MESGRHVADTPRTAPKRKMKPLWLVIVIDILLAGVILCTFSLFHHVIPSMNAKRAASVKPSAPTPTVAVTPAAEATPGERDVDRERSAGGQQNRVAEEVRGAFYRRDSRD